MRPTSFPNGTGRSFLRSEALETRHTKKEICPIGRVPIYRTTNDQLQRGQFIANKLFNDPRVESVLPGNSHVSTFIFWFLIILSINPKLVGFI